MLSHTTLIPDTNLKINHVFVRTYISMIEKPISSLKSSARSMNLKFDHLKNL